ncbi:SHOCT domain-containing protein [Streptomyces sp. NPDC029216]|uniref:SHOCT domain-containing protein n=1 Tax=Streptomyces sp. NPDC029216 TaxID=3154701 RepID=UPI0033C28D10
MSLTTLIIWTLIVAVAFLVIRSLRRDGTGSSTAQAPRPAGGNEAERLLAERFARGEIDDEEYTRRLGILRKHGSWPTMP